MDREIKFEIKLKAKEPINGYKVGETLIIINSIFDLSNGVAFHPINKKFEIVYKRQFTGLKDKNGKEIYEGDVIFNSNRTLITMNEDKRLYVVKWQDGEYNNQQTWLQKNPGFIFEKIIVDGKKYMDLIFSKEQIEVIGNIYENPELINE